MALDIERMRKCAPLLPEPGNEVVVTCLDELERAYGLLRELSKWDHMATAGDGSYWLGEIAKTLEGRP